MPMRRRYDKAGILAINPTAFFDLFLEPDAPEVVTVAGNAVVEIRGPLEHHDGWWCDSYEAILDRVTDACAGESSTIILKIDSPGGELFGAFDAARAIRARCAAAGKRLVAYVDGCACSAAYALACAASEIVTSETAFTGSIGVLITRVDVTARDAREGVGISLVASGKRKVDGHPHSALSQPELEAMQSQCDALAELFFELVASLRGVSTDALRALEADVFHGPLAVEKGLADRVASFDELLELLATKGTAMADDTKDEGEEKPTPSSSQKDVDDARSALERAAADGDQKAQAALDVLNGGGDDDEEEDEDEPEASAARPATAPAASRGASVSADSAAGLAKRFEALEKRQAKIERENDRLKFDALLTGRTDLGKDLREHLATMPYKDAKAIVDRMPKPKTPTKEERAASAVVGATRGQGEGDGTTGPGPSREAEEFDKAFGLTKHDERAVRREGTSLVFDAAAQVRAVNSRKPAPATTTPATAEKGN